MVRAVQPRFEVDCAACGVTTDTSVTMRRHRHYLRPLWLCDTCDTRIQRAKRADASSPAAAAAHDATHDATHDASDAAADALAADAGAPGDAGAEAGGPLPRGRALPRKHPTCKMCGSESESLDESLDAGVDQLQGGQRFYPCSRCAHVLCAGCVIKHEGRDPCTSAASSSGVGAGAAAGNNGAGNAGNAGDAGDAGDTQAVLSHPRVCFNCVDLMGAGEGDADGVLVSPLETEAASAVTQYAEEGDNELITAVSRDWPYAIQVRVLKKGGNIFRVGIFLDFVRLTARAEGPHGAHVMLGWVTGSR